MIENTYVKFDYFGLSFFSPPPSHSNLSYYLTIKANTYPSTPKRQCGNAFNPPSINNTSTPKGQLQTMKQIQG